MKRFLKTLGPGLLFASAAIGVSHLVQSTRAGADYGYLLIPVVIAANLFKYPFFEYGSRYANATGSSLIDGYLKLGKWMLWLYFVMILGSMFFVTAAVGSVTSGFLQNLLGTTSYGMETTVILFSFCLLALIIGSFKTLDQVIKLISVVMFITTIIVFILALIKGPTTPIVEVKAPSLFSDTSVLFIIALMGWMPTAVDLSTWVSLWTLEKNQQELVKPDIKQSLFEFNIGYLFSAILAIIFVILGAFTIYGAGIQLPKNSGEFANEVIHIFTGFLGDWSYLIIAAAAFSIMFGTCITVFDGYGRSLERSCELLFFQNKKISKKLVYRLSLVIVVVGSFFIIWQFGRHMTVLVDLATIISFLIAPIIAIVNYKLVTSSDFPSEARPGLWLRVLSWAGIIFLSGFSIYYAYVVLKW